VIPCGPVGQFLWRFGGPQWPVQVHVTAKSYYTRDWEWIPLTGLFNLQCQSTTGSSTTISNWPVSKLQRSSGSVSYIHIYTHTHTHIYIHIYVYIHTHYIRWIHNWVTKTVGCGTSHQCTNIHKFYSVIYRTRSTKQYYKSPWHIKKFIYTVNGGCI